MIKTISGILFFLIFSNSVLAVESIISIKSPYSIEKTAKRFEEILKKKGLTIFARINHSENAASVNLDLAPSEVIIFGNPKIGTPLMKCSKTVAIDLPQKALFWKDDKDQTWLSYNNPEYLKGRHNIKDCDQLLIKVSNVLNKLTKAATSK